MIRSFPISAKKNSALIVDDNEIQVHFITIIAFITGYFCYVILDIFK